MIWAALLVSGIFVVAGWWVSTHYVSLVAYEDIVRIADMEREHNRKLTRMMMRLKVTQQAYLPAKADVRAERAQDKIEIAISRSKHARNPAIRTALSNFAEAEKLKGTSTDEIVRRLGEWDRIKDDLRDEEDDAAGDLLA